MEKIVETLKKTDNLILDITEKYFSDRKVIMFDIETTGLSAQRSFTYIIGINVYENGHWTIIQLFNDDGMSESEMIDTFLKMLPDYDVLVEFNGDRFDIPYIRTRMDFISSKTGFRFKDTFNDIPTVDLMKVIKPYKFALGLPNIKQKTIEKYMDIHRIDMYNGGQLIDVYLSYLSALDNHSKSLVLQHNRDDMAGMIEILPVLSVEAFSNGFFDVSGINMVEKANKTQSEYYSGLNLVINLNLKMSLKKPIYTYSNGVSLEAEGHSATLSVPVFNRELFFFASNDTEPMGKSSLFVPSFKNEIQCLAMYKEPKRSKEFFVELNDSFLGNPEAVKKYAELMTSDVLHAK